MKVICYEEYGARNSVPVFSAFKHGVRNCGDDIVRDYVNADCVVLWSILFTGRMAPAKAIWERALKDKKPIVVLEVGALLRDRSWKMGLNGINNQAAWCDPFEKNRWDKFGIESKEWKNDGEFITICTQRPDSTQWNGMPSIEDYVKFQIASVRKHSDKPIVVRPHPRDKYTKWNFLKGKENVFFDVPKVKKNTYDSFNHQQIFERSECVINHSSGPSIQAALDGIKVVTSEDSLAWDVSIDVSDINKDVNVDKTDWLQKLSHTEFFLEEIETGEPWLNLKRKI